MSADDVALLGRRWFAYAEEDLEAAEASLSAGRPPRHVCFWAQQAAEKALKTILVLEQVDSPRMHDLERLRTLLPDGWELKEVPVDLETLSQWATASRYPDVLPIPTEHDAEYAVEQARRVVKSVRDDLLARGSWE